mgnify:CR=1 FL=1
MSLPLLDDLQKFKQLLLKAKKEQLTVKKAARLLKAKESEVKTILLELEKLGYLEEAHLPGYWQLALRGDLLIHQPIERVFKVSSMKRQVSNLIERVQHINRSDKYTHNITHLKITSEYPITKVGNGVDISYVLQRKKLSKKEYNRRAYNLRVESKIPTYNIIEEFTHPMKVVERFLKSRSHIIKLKEVGEKTLLSRPGALLFEMNSNEFS